MSRKSKRRSHTKKPPEGYRPPDPKPRIEGDKTPAHSFGVNKDPYPKNDQVIYVIGQTYTFVSHTTSGKLGPFRHVRMAGHDVFAGENLSEETKVAWFDEEIGRYVIEGIGDFYELMILTRDK